jgi:hypothetical protein
MTKIPLHCEGVPNGRGSPVPRYNYPVASRHPFMLKGNYLQNPASNNASPAVNIRTGSGVSITNKS